MLAMAKAPKPSKPKRGRPPGKTREYVAFQVRFGVKLHRQLLKALAVSRRTKNAEVELALEQHLATIGLWPAEDED